MDRLFRNMISVLFIVALSFLVISCKTTPDTKTSETKQVLNKDAEVAKSGMVKGKLITMDGLKFAYRFYPTNIKGASVLYIPGTGGFMTYRRAGSGSYALGEPLNKNGINYFTFERAGASSYLNTWDKHYKNLTKRTKTGYTYFLTKDGKESAAQNIIRNEVKTAIEYIEETPTHDPEKGIYLVGSSYGSWLAMVTVNSFPSRIKGVVFLSPSILREWVTTDQEKYPQLNIVEYWSTLVNVFGKDRPALAVGGAKEKLRGAKGWPTWPAIDGANFLQEAIGSNVEVYDTSFSELHGIELFGHEPEVTTKVVQWITDVKNR